MTGTRLFGGAGDPANYLLGAPAVGTDGAIYVQSNVILYAFEPDGRPRWTWPLVGQAESAEPVQGLFAPSILDDMDVLVSSPGHQTVVDNSPTQIWTSTTYGASETGGHWGLGDDGSASYVLDLRTGQTAGRLRTQGGHDVIPVIAPLNGGILTMDRDNGAALHLVMFDHCGKQQWTFDIPGTKVCPGIGLVGLDEVLYLSVGSCAGGQPSPEIIAIDAAGQMKGTPIATKQAPWAVGADGTLYAIDMGLVSPPSTLTALSPGLVQQWTLSIPGTVGARAGAVLRDDGVLFAQIDGKNGNAVIAIQTTSPGLAPSSWPLSRHDNRRTNWAGGTF